MVPFMLANRYEIEEEIGRGGIGTVYRARCRLLNRTVAIKVLHPHLAENEVYRRHLWQEARAAAALSHPNIISIYDLVEEGEQFFLVMEYFPGENLRSLLQREGPLSPDRAAGIVYQVCLALAEAHRQGIIHRDIKPHNILVNSTNQVKVADFGLAANIHDSSLQTEQLVGSLPYLAPERIKGKGACFQTDIYSTGIVLYELLTGKTPFAGSSPAEIAGKHLHEEPVPVNEVSPAVSPLLAAVVQKALAKDPAARFPDAAAFARALKPFLEAEDEESTRALVIPGRTSSFAKLPASRSSRRRTAFAGAILLCLAFLVSFGYFTAGVRVPPLQGLSLEEASRTLAQARLQAHPWRQIYNENLGAGRVMAQWPPAGSRVLKGFPVFLTISLGSRFASVPDVRGRPVSEAVNELRKAGFRVAGSNQEGVVADTTPPPNTRHPRGTMIRLSVKQTASPERETVITVRLFQKSTVQLVVQDYAGRRTAYHRQMEAGEYKIPISTYGAGVILLYVDQNLVRSIPIS